MLTQGRLLAKEMPEEELSQERDNFESVEERALFSGFNHINVLDPYLETRDRLRRNDQKVREYLKQVKILDLKFDIHISAGYVYGQAQTPDEVYEMIREADRMLYQSKDNVRNQISGGPSRYN
ncbi:hypothetical protein [Lactobacillus delbrueckii]|uniref:hypothetical protein n=1 Tax=Lactobacillus delbrueckii TaxID=1584 RepID=UPI001E32D7BD|nr:hypothetical protein [Lactobacillus delbrueckii]MCD5440708.1 hypothetical protein [Lactobacillus delbrueckii subsp. lactis]MCD5452780.1 hypothetical protein [Lactobacillus delbrueckii subsp. lactis]MCD5484682.1 hypothetical protein [Lactobacillus delbrueckii subsp. lactis]MCD5527280.1 hypothetical protein [Lactobacillus delbrueckii subsp. lactis]MCD5539514.1 hypothetical protein [Lactobacillus delbrueckii subsp. lactis]